MRPTLLARALSAVTGLAAAAAWVRTVMDYVRDEGLFRGLWDMFMFYTHWAVLIVAILFCGVALGNRWCARPAVIGSTIILLGIMIVHYWTFRGLTDFLSTPLRSRLVHGPLALMALASCAAIIPPGSLRWSDALRWCTVPMIYTAYGMVRGALTGIYPYEVADVRHYGYAMVLLLIGVTIAASIATGLAVVGLDRLRARARAAIADI